MRISKKNALAALAIGTMLSVAAPGHATELKATPIVDDTVIRLGDIFEDIGDKASMIFMEAPAPGAKKKLTSYDLDRIAKEFELDWKRPSYIRTIHILREGTAFSLNELEDLIVDNATSQGLMHDVQVRIYGSQQGLFLPTGAGIHDIELEHFSLNERMDRFTATALIPTGGPLPRQIRLTGNLVEIRLVPMLNRIIAPGEIISEADVAWAKFPARRLNRNSVTALKDLIGQTVRRPVQPGAPLRVNDLKAPVVIAKGSVVKMTIQAGALTLTTDGRALQDGGHGDTIRVMNTRSNQSVDAKVIRPGLVKALSNNVALAAL